MSNPLVPDLLNSLANPSVDPEMIEFNKALGEKSFQEVLDYSSKAKNDSEKIYCCALLLGKVEQSPDVDFLKKHEALMKTLNILELQSDKQEDFLNCFDDILCRTFFDCKSLKEAISMAQFLNPIKSDSHVRASANIAFTIACEKLLLELKDFSLEPNLKNYKKLLKYIQRGIAYGVKLECYLIMVVPELMNMLGKIVNEDYLLRITDKEARLAWKIIDIFEKIEMGENPFSQEIVRFRILLEESNRHRIDHLARKGVSESYKSEIIYNIFPKDLVQSDICLNTKDSNFLISNIFKGTWMGKPVCLKVYQEKSPGASFANVEDEIRIYQGLAPLRFKGGCFLEYCGTCIEKVGGKRKITLVMQWVDKSLKNFIEDMINQDIPHDESRLKLMFTKLLYSFSLLHEFNFFHLDIKPPNILTDGHSYYIIDFDVSIVDIGSKTQQTKTISGGSYACTVGYADPEIQKTFETSVAQGYSRSKADVFSLGMTFYHILVGRNFTTDLNKAEKMKELKEGIDGLPYPWAVELLSKMLDFDRKNRISMKEATDLMRDRVGIDPVTGEVYVAQTSAFVVE